MCAPRFSFFQNHDSLLFSGNRLWNYLMTLHYFPQLTQTLSVWRKLIFYGIAKSSQDFSNIYERHLFIFCRHSTRFHFHEITRTAMETKFTSYVQLGRISSTVSTVFFFGIWIELSTLLAFSNQIPGPRETIFFNWPLISEKMLR